MQFSTIMLVIVIYLRGILYRRGYSSVNSSLSTIHFLIRILLLFAALREYFPFLTFLLYLRTIDQDILLIQLLADLKSSRVPHPDYKRAPSETGGRPASSTTTVSAE